jgi:hypothetical protein
MHEPELLAEIIPARWTAHYTMPEFGTWRNKLNDTRHPDFLLAQL